MKLIIAGKNNIAVNIAKQVLSSHSDVELFGVTNLTDDGVDSFQLSFKKFCCENSIPIIDLESAYELHDSVFLSLEFDRIVKPDRFNHSNIYNIHFSELPKYKGMYTSAWPILNGERQSGVTLHKIDSGIDTGDIVSQTVFDLEREETAESLYLKYIEHGTDLVRVYLAALIKGTVTLEAQSSEGASYYSRKSIDYKSIQINLHKTADEIRRQLNAFTFRAYQLPSIFEQKIRGARVLESKSSGAANLIRESSRSFMVSTIDYDIEIFKEQLPDLLDACRTGDIAGVKMYVNEFNVNDKNDKGWSPIIVAAYFGNLEAIKLLLSLGANINDVNFKGTSVMMYAKDYLLRTKASDFFESLIELGGDVYMVDMTGQNLFDYVEKTEIEDYIELLSEFK